MNRLGRRIRELEDRDPLTCTASRTAFVRALEEGVSNSRAAAAPITVAVIDCDSFKAVNDSFGHCFGDEVLRNAGEILSQRVESRGTVSRLWGDAFAVVLPRVAFDEARCLVDELPSALRSRMAEREWPITFSIGAATFDHPSEDWKQLLRAADAVMYTVKRGGRNGLKHVRVAGGCGLDESQSPIGASPNHAADEQAHSGNLPASA
jgi:diguanylate cyclase (GGDEF)-like protein